MNFYNKLLVLAGAALTSSLAAQAQPGTITTVAGRGTIMNAAAVGGPATNAALQQVLGVATDNSGNIYIPLPRAVRRVNTDGILTTAAGTDTMGYAGDGNAATAARVGYTWGVATDRVGNLYFSDASSYVVRRVDAWGTITTYAGNGVRGNIGNGGLAVSCELGRIYDLATDKDNNLYMADYDNQVVWKVGTDGYINIVAGNKTAGYSGDGGPATSAQLHNPWGVAADDAGNLYISAGYDQVIRKVNTSGVITTIAGNGTAGLSGDGAAATAAQLNAPKGLGIDGAGNLYVADYNNNRVRKINTDGIITTVAGSDSAGYTGNGGPALNARLSGPVDVATDGAGNLYISDQLNRCIRKVSSTLGTAAPKTAAVAFWPNPSAGVLQVEGRPGTYQIYIENMAGQVVYSTTVIVGSGTTPTLALPASVQAGVYMLRYSHQSGSGSMRLTLIR